MLLSLQRVQMMYQDFGAQTSVFVSVFPFVVLLLGVLLAGSYFVKKIPNILIYILTAIGLALPFIFFIYVFVLPAYSVAARG